MYVKYIYASPEKTYCPHTAATEPQSVAYSDNISHKSVTLPSVRQEMTSVRIPFHIL